MTARLVAADTKDHCMSSLDMYGIIKVFFQLMLMWVDWLSGVLLFFVSPCLAVAYLQSGLGCRLEKSVMCATAVVSKGVC
jgi:hypothetical protein